ncbi:PDZ domain-containing protein, partial [Thermodesulfobacteriota bacterium]
PFIVASTEVGKTVVVKVIRNGKKKSLKVKISELKEVKEAEVAAEEGSDLGMAVEEITPEMARQYGLSEKAGGLVVVQVEENSPAGEAGIRKGDIIVEVDQESVRDLAGYKRKIRQYKKGDTILFLMKRESATLYLTLKMWE